MLSPSILELKETKCKINGNINLDLKPWQLQILATDFNQNNDKLIFCIAYYCNLYPSLNNLSFHHAHNCNLNPTMIIPPARIGHEPLFSFFHFHKTLSNNEVAVQKSVSQNSDPRLG
ncbi:hypothetical protein VNO77_17843 [Canavalia gladiata]|uniref:Uncharacterized protein n=1 Tax=Canavalia gladiata TaxID=3824 RepID=A0AAN9QN30_CANGL